MKKIDLKISTPNPENESLIGLIKSMICKNFGSNQDINSIEVILSEEDDARIPYRTTIDLVLGSSKASIQTESSSAHYLSSFTQALSRMERQLGKAEAQLV